MKKSCAITAALVSPAFCSFKLGVFTGININPNYDWSNVSNCLNYVDDWDTTWYAPLGRIGCDPPADLLKALVKSMAYEIPLEIDGIVVPGDWLPHFNEGEYTYEEKIQMITDIHDIIRAEYPDTPILPAFGNQDFTADDAYGMVAPRFWKHAEEYYTQIYDLYFDNPNEDIQYISDKEQFTFGGYYEYPLADGLYCVLSMNSNYFMGVYSGQVIEQTAYQEEVAWAQLAWLRETLEANEYTHYVLVYHLVPGINWEQYNNWRTDYRDEFLDIISTYAEIIDYSISGHARLGSVRTMINDETQTKLFNNAVVPTVSPVDGTQPSYSMFVTHGDEVTLTLNNYFVDLDSTYTEDYQTALDTLEATQSDEVAISDILPVTIIEIEDFTVDGILDVLLETDDIVAYMMQYLGTSGHLSGRLEEWFIEEFQKTLPGEDDYMNEDLLCYITQSATYEQYEECRELVLQEGIDAILAILLAYDSADWEADELLIPEIPVIVVPEEGDILEGDMIEEMGELPPPTEIMEPLEQIDITQLSSVEDFDEAPMTSQLTAQFQIASLGM